MYIRQRHSLYQNWNIRDSQSTDNWLACDIGKLISGDKLSLTQVEAYLDIKLDILKLKTYKNRNNEVLYNTLKLSYNNLIGDSWLTSLINYCKDVNLD